MPKFFDPTPEQRGELEAIAAAIPGVQKTFVLNHPHVNTLDRGAHQQQIAASKVLLTVADRLPPELDGLGVFQHTGYDEPLVGIGRISTGLGCPHAERHAGLGAVRIAAHVTAQTNRTVRSTSAYQQYWTGIVRARDVLGKFTFVPAADVAPAVSHGATRFTDDWRARQSAGDLSFDLRWIPYLDDRRTPAEDLTRPWAHDHEISVGRVTFPQTDFDTIESKLTTLLASELGANQGNWDEIPGGQPSGRPATRFTAARQLAYGGSQEARHALPDESYEAFFERGTVGPELAEELVRRYQQKRAVGHWVPDIGELPIA